MSERNVYDPNYPEQWPEEYTTARFSFYVRGNHPKNQQPRKGNEIFPSWREERMGKVDWNNLNELMIGISNSPLLLAEVQEGHKAVYDHYADRWVNWSPDYQDLAAQDFDYEQGYADGSSYRDKAYNSEAYLQGYEDGWGDRDNDLLDDISS